MTLSDFSARVGAWQSLRGRVLGPAVSLRVRLLDVRTRVGVVEVSVSPGEGLGSFWVEADRVEECFQGEVS